MEQQHYDALIIGSGMGALTTACLLAKIGKKRVLILEKHWTVGGLTHQFERKGKYSWEVGIHYVGQAAGNFFPAKVFRFLTEGKLEWERIASPYDTFVYPDARFEVPDNKKEYVNKLSAQFPKEEAAIRRYFKDVNAVAQWGVREYMSSFAPPVVAGTLKLLNRRLRKVAQMPTQSYLDQYFKDEKLKALLVSIWGDYGVPPAQSAFMVHALITAHYLDGAYYPKGGSHRIAETILPSIKAAGGDYLLNCEVQEILLESGKAVGCRCLVQRTKGIREETFYAPIIISNAGVYPTFRRLLRQPLFPELEQLQGRDSMVVVYLGLKDNPEKLGVSGGNFWIFNGYNHNEPPKIEGENPHYSLCFLSFPSLKDRSRKAHTAELITVVPYTLFQTWAHKDWKQRGEDYEQLKQQIANGLLQMVEKALPGFNDLVDYIEIASPLSMEKFTGRPWGAPYGLPQTPERLLSSVYQARTPIPNLYLTGGDVFALGLVGAMMGGISTACQILGKWSFFKVMPQLMKGH